MSGPALAVGKPAQVVIHESIMPLLVPCRFRTRRNRVRDEVIAVLSIVVRRGIVASTTAARTRRATSLSARMQGGNICAFRKQAPG